ncbi:MAG TPA: hypothetical protein VEJ38_02505 [Candidatus Acidoferrales bacterium]|nr:hypothetical protein [Candidatus Acidoferrales bacterium]
MSYWTKTFRAFTFVALLWAACVSLVAAQGFKRPAPTAADWAALAKLPDFTGVWEVSMGPAPSTSRIINPAIGVPSMRPTALSLTPAYEVKRQVLMAHAEEDNQSANCLPPGMPGIMAQPYPMEFLLTPGQVTIVIEAYSMVRHIYTDGRPLPDDPDPNFFGTSIGHWEGDTLVVQTVGFSTQTEIEPHVPHSDKMRILEKFRLLDPNTMSIETEVTDPEALTAPYVTNRILKRHRSWTIAEYICEQNNRNFVDQSGKAGINLTPPSDASPAPKQ